LEKEAVMRPKKWIMLAAAIVCGLILCACNTGNPPEAGGEPDVDITLLPEQGTAQEVVLISSDGQHNVDVSYLDAKISENTLKLTVNYDSGREFFEIGRDIVVAADSSFENPWRMRRCNVVDENYVYEFEPENLSDLKGVYIKPPILYMPVEITPVSVPIVEGEMARMSTGDMEFGTVGTDWFSVDTVDIEKYLEGVYKVRVVVKANAKDLPRLPKLVNGETRIGGTSALNFDQNDNFDYGEFLFTVNAGSEKEVAASSLVVSDALIRVEAGDLDISSNVKSFFVVGGESE